MNLKDRKELFDKDLHFIENSLKKNENNDKIKVILTHMCPLMIKNSEIKDLSK